MANGQFNYSKGSKGHKNVNTKAGKGERLAWALQYNPKTHTAWVSATAKDHADGPFMTGAQGRKVSSKEIEALASATGGFEKGKNGMMYLAGFSSLNTSPQGAFPDAETASGYNKRQQAQMSAEQRFNAVREAWGNTKQAEAPAKEAKEAPAKTVGETRKAKRPTFSGKEFDARKDQPGYDIVKTAQHEPERKGNFLIKESAKGNFVIVNNPVGKDNGGYINDTKGLSEMLKDVPAIDLGEGAKGYDIQANLEFGDNGLKLIGDSIQPRGNAFKNAGAFEARYAEAKDKAESNKSAYEASKDAEVTAPAVDEPELG